MAEERPGPEDVSAHSSRRSRGGRLRRVRAVRGATLALRVREEAILLVPPGYRVVRVVRPEVADVVEALPKALRIRAFRPGRTRVFVAYERAPTLWVRVRVFRSRKDPPRLRDTDAPREPGSNRPRVSPSQLGP